jgi:hypothetical protein
MRKPHLLINLPPGFYTTPAVQPLLRRARRLGTLRLRSHNTPDEIRADLAWAELVVRWSWPPLLADLLDGAPGLRMSAQLDITQAAARVAIAARMSAVQHHSQRMVFLSQTAL